MRAIQFAEYGGPEVLKLVEVQPPHAGPGQIRIAVRAVGVNPADFKKHTGAWRFQQAELPAGLGAQGAGVVDEVGDGVTGVIVGDEVFGLGDDMYAEHAVLSSWALKSAAMSFEDAAAIPAAADVANRLFDLVDLRAGQTLLVNGAAGGAGSGIVQLARRRGATVIGTASESKHDYLRSLGITPVAYGDGLVDRVRAIASDGVDAAFDVAGSDVIDDLVALTGDPNRVVTLTLAQAQEHPEVLSTFSVGEHVMESLADAARAFDEGDFRMHIARIFPLEEAGAATQAVSEHRTMGKLIVVVS
ncbi:NADP-dependent oxidoreductase [Plantibacter sp. M259]|uniref:NADP-dependent oxidoreductase n=1 Tax=Plantibacter sp. M259 TaxID=2583822 RepID=UPI001110C2A4|nr:NADP-dependent oxidoreductase [Plantibacter sp. M259]